MEPLRAISARTAASRLAVCLLPAACCLLLTGCQNSGRQMQTDLYQRELRLQEDEIYRLEDYIDEYQGIIAGYRCEIDDLKRELAESQSNRSVAPTTTRPNSVQLSPPRRDAVSSLLTTPEPTAFDPPPAVDSAIVRMIPLAQPLDCDVALLEKVVTQAFSQRRKVIRNCLSGLFTEAQLVDAGVDPQARPEAVAVEGFVALANRLRG